MFHQEQEAVCRSRLQINCSCFLLPARYYFRAGSAHFFDRALAVAGLKFNCTHRVFQGFNFEAVLQRV